VEPDRVGKAISGLLNPERLANQKFAQNLDIKIYLLKY